MIGSIIGGYIGDKYGRKFTMNLGMIICLVFGLLVSLSKNYLILALLKISSAIGMGFVVCNSPTHLAETFLKKQ